MKPAPFRYARAGSLAEALALLAEAPGDTKLLAGGQSLVPMLNMRLVRPAVLVDVNGLRELVGIAPTAEDGLRIGALTRHAELAASPAVRERAPLLAEAARHVGHAAIRNQGTLGGSLAHADPAAELPAAVLALDARIQIRGPRGAREVAADAFFRGLLATALEPDEILTAIDIPAQPPGWGFVEIARRPGDFALAGVAAVIRARHPLTLPSPPQGRGGSAARGVRRGGSAAPAHGRGARADRGAARRGERGAGRRRGRARLRSAERRAWLRRLSSPPGHRAGRARAAPGGRAPRGPAAMTTPGERLTVRLSVNGEAVEQTVEARRSLADFLREDLGLTGTHVGCEHGVCGACTVLVDGRSARSCLLFAAQLDGRAVTTIEGLTPAEGLSPLQESFRLCHAMQCGFCTPGMIVTTTELLAQEPAPSTETIREAISGNLCMCTGYVNIVRAVERAVAARATGARA